MEGPVRDLLAAERIALNFTQRMSGIATMTASFVDAVNAIYDDGHDGTVTRPHRYERTRIVDTRKTTPGLRVEASGNMSMERGPAVAATGVDVISVGALTHSVRSIDLGLDWN